MYVQSNYQVKPDLPNLMRSDLIIYIAGLKKMIQLALRTTNGFFITIFIGTKRLSLRIVREA